MSWEGDILKKLRHERRLTQEEFSKWLEIPKRTYEKWESGENVPPTWVVKLIRFKCEKSTQGEQLNVLNLIPTKNKIYYFCYNIDDKGKTGVFRGEFIDSIKHWIKNAKGKARWIDVHEVIKTYNEEDFTNFMK